MSCPVVRWARCPHDDHLHAVDRRDAELTSVRGYAEALCGHTIPADGLTFQEAPSGALCMPCVVGVTSDLPDPGRMGTAL